MLFNSASKFLRAIFKNKPSITLDQKLYSKDTKTALVKYNENKLTFDIRDFLQQALSPLSSIRFISTGQPVFIKKLTDCPKPKDNRFDPCKKDSWQLRDQQLEETKKPEEKPKTSGKDSSVRPRRCDGVWVPKVIGEYELKEKEKLEKEKRDKAFESGTGGQLRILAPGCGAPKDITCPHAFEMECICKKVLTPFPSFSECIDTVSPGHKCSECGPLKLKACFVPPPEPVTCSTIKKQYKAKMVKERPVPPMKPYDQRDECKTTTFCEEPPVRADDVNPIEFKELPCILPIQMKRGNKTQKRNYSTFAVSRRFMSTNVPLSAEDKGNSSGIPMPKRQYDPVTKEVPWNENYSTFAVSRRFMSTNVLLSAEDKGNFSGIPMPKRQYDPVTKEVPWNENYSTFAVSRRFMSTNVLLSAEDKGNFSGIPMPKRQYDPVTKEVPWNERKECANREAFCKSKEAPIRADDQMKKKGGAKVKPLPNIFKTPQSREYSTVVKYPRVECEKVKRCRPVRIKRIRNCDTMYIMGEMDRKFQEVRRQTEGSCLPAPTKMRKSDDPRCPRIILPGCPNEFPQTSCEEKVPYVPCAKKLAPYKAFSECKEHDFKIRFSECTVCPKKYEDD